MDVSNDQLFQQLIQNRGLKEGSITRYKYQLTLYCKFLNKTPTELIEEAEQEEDQGLRLRSRNVKKYLLDFKQYLEESNYSPKNITNTLTVIRTFYNEYDIQLARMPLKRKYPKETLEAIPTKDDLKLALTYANMKYKAIILLISSSGIYCTPTHTAGYNTNNTFFRLGFLEPISVTLTLFTIISPLPQLQR